MAIRAPDALIMQFIVQCILEYKVYCILLCIEQYIVQCKVYCKV